MIKIYNGDCLKAMELISDRTVDTIVTSPPYNTTPHISEKSTTTLEEEQKKRKYYVGIRYDGFCDAMPNDKYAKFCADCFDGFDRIVKDNGTVLWNVSIGAENTSAMFLAISEIISRGKWIVADQLIWKKSCAIPLNTSRNLTTRICENVFVFCRPSERVTFHANKKALTVSKSGQSFYETPYNLIDAKNNDGATMLNRATFSTELVRKLLKMYGRFGDDKGLVYDPFMETGTTASAARDLSYDCIGSELSAAQCDYAVKRLDDMFTSVEIVKI